MSGNFTQKLAYPLTISLAAVAILGGVLLAAVAKNEDEAPSGVAGSEQEQRGESPPATPSGDVAAVGPDTPSENGPIDGQPPEGGPALQLREPEEGALNIIGMIPLHGQRLEKQIVLFFDDDIVLPTSSDGTPGKPFTLSPPLKGEFRVERNYAAFLLTPNQSLPPSAYFDLCVEPGIRSKDGKALGREQGNLRVAMFAFEPQRVWLLEKNEERTVLGIFFPVTVDVGALRACLEVRDGSDREVPFSLEYGTSKQSFRLFVDSKAEIPLKLKVEAGLRDAQGQFTLALDRTFTYPADPFFHVEEVKWGGRSDTYQDVLIRFSKPVRGEDLRWHAVFTNMPDKERIPFEVPDREASTQHRVRLMREGEDGAVRVALSADLPGEQATRLVEDYTEILPPVPMPLAVAGTQWGPSANSEFVLFIRFSSPVARKDLEEHLTIVDEKTNEPLEYTIDTRQIADSHRVRFSYLSPEGPRVTLRVSDGLTAPDKSVLLESYTASLKWSPPKLYIHNLAYNTEGAAGIVVRVRLNRVINVTDLQKHLQVFPDVGEVRAVAGNRMQYTLYAKWRMDVPYEIRVQPGVKFADGSLSSNTATRSFTINDLRPALAFSHPGKYYFTMREGTPLSIQSFGLHQTRVTVHRVFPSNVVYALGRLTQEEEYDFRRRGARESVDDTIAEWAEKLYEKNIELAYGRGEVTDTNLDMADVLPADKRGVFCLEAECKVGDVNYRAEKLVMFTNIGLLSHWQDDQVVLFAHDLMTLAPLERARVSIYSTKRQLMHMGYTDGSGVLRAGGFDTELGEPQLAIVEFGDDTAFLELIPRKDDTAAIKPGMPRYDSEAYDAFLYADRDLYRPGETVHLRWMVRTDFGDALADVPLEFVIGGPRNREIRRQPTTLSAFGTNGFDYVTSKTDPTGEYSVELRLPGSHDAPIGSYRFRLEEFVPNRLKTTVELPAKEMRPDTEYPIVVKAEHLFGASGADRKSACEVVLEKSDWKPEAWPGYRFSNDRHFTRDRVNCGEEQTDEDGKATYTFSYVPVADATFPLRVTAFGSVFELGGRVVTQKADAVFFPSDICLGVRASKPSDGSGVEVHVAAVTPDGAPADLTSVKVTLER